MVEPAALSRMARLRREMDVDLHALEARAQEAATLCATWAKDGSLGRPELVLLAVNIHGYYTALETLFERVAASLDDLRPTGAAWHVELIEQMRTEVPGLRPALVDDGLVADVHELRKFRHFFRNAYVLELQPELVRAQAERLVRIHPPLVDPSRALRRQLDALIEALATSA